MKRLLILVTAFLSLLPVMAQQKDHHSEHAKMRKEYREYKMKVIAQELELKGETRNRFFEVYNEMCDERAPLMHELGSLRRRINKEANISDEEYMTINKAMTEGKEKDARIEQKYDEKFATFLTAKQIYQMKGIEEKIRKKALEMKGRKQKKK